MLTRRKGNLLITVLAFFCIVLITTAMLNLSITQQNFERQQAINAGKTTSYIALANLCADAFRSDLESQRTSYMAGVMNPTGDFSQEIFNSGAGSIQSNLENRVGPAGMPDSWYHYMSDPNDVIGFIGLMEEDSVKLAEKLLDGATVSILVYAPLEARNPISNTILVSDGEDMPLTDINFRVVLEKGMTQIIQDYRLSDENLSIRMEKVQNGGDWIVNYVWVVVDGEDASCDLIGQTVTLNNTHKLNG